MHIFQLNQRNQILFQYLGDKKKKRKLGAQKKGGWKFTHFTSPASVPGKACMFPLEENLRVSSFFFFFFFFFGSNLLLNLYLEKKFFFFLIFWSWPVENTAVYGDKKAIRQWCFIFVNLMGKRQVIRVQVLNCWIASQSCVHFLAASLFSDLICLEYLVDVVSNFFLGLVKDIPFSSFFFLFLVGNLLILFHFIRMKRAPSIFLFVMLLPCFAP